MNIGALSLVLTGCSGHRSHHRYTDTDKDPYSVRKGLLYSQYVCLFTLPPLGR